MARQKTLLTAEEFFRLYSHKDGRYELVDGEVVEMAPVNEQHGAVALNIGAGFNLYSRQSGIGRASVETGYRLRISPDTVRGPDVSFVVAGKEAWESLGDGFSPDAPDIAVEVVSPSNTAAEIERKVGEYLAAGSQRVWVVYTSSRNVLAHRAEGATITYSGDEVITDEELLPGFSLPLSDIFR